MRKQPLNFLTLAFIFSGLAVTSSSFKMGTDETAPSVHSQTEDSRLYSAKEQVADFRGVAKKAVPAVVSIKVQTQKKSTLLNDGVEGLDPSGSDLWELFGLPKKDSSRPQIMTGQASGVIVSPDGYILTNSHVVNGMDSISVQLTDGREFNAKVLGDDPNSDLALIKIEAKDLPHLLIGNSDDLEVGQWVAAVGNPFGLQATLTAGVVSAKSRNNLDIVPYADFIQTDASINRGNSGGPLLTLNGEVIGINTAIATDASSGYMGIGFAIPSNMAKHVMDEILSDGKVSHGFLGVSLQSINYNLAQAFGLKKVEGALVANVVKDSSADKAGLQVEDIITAYNGRAVDNAATLRNAVFMMKPGTQLTLTVLRKDKQIQIPIALGNHEESKVVASTSTPHPKSPLGIDVDTLTPELARSLGYSQEQGVVITNIKPSSIASLSGLKKGALIIAVNRNKVTNLAEYKKALAEIPADKPILLQVKQGGNYIFVSLQTE